MSYLGRIFIREELIYFIWGVDFNGDNCIIDVYVKRLCERFEYIDDFVIMMVWGVGYKFEVIVKWRCFICGLFW